MSKIPRRVAHLVSAPCSTGKTFATCRYIADNQYLHNVIYTAPSLDLLTQTAATLSGMGVTPTVITSETHPNNVKQTIVAYLKEAGDIGSVLLITWQAAIDLPFVPGWLKIIDEVPPLDRHYAWNLSRNPQFITEHLRLELPTGRSKLARVSLTDRKVLEENQRKNDSVDELFREFYRDLMSPHKEMWVDVASWRRVVQGEEDADAPKASKAEKHRIHFLSMLRPHFFDEAILLGANIEDSLLYRWLGTRHDFRFETFQPIAEKLRPAPNIGKRLIISYSISGRNATKTLYRKTDANGVSLVDRMDLISAAAFGDEPFLSVPNNNRKSHIDGLRNARKIPVVSHGLNGYADYHNICISAALNREPRHFAMLAELGLEADHVHRATAHETYYQAVMRTSLRDPDSTAMVHAVLPDEPSARWLAALTGATEVRAAWGRFWLRHAAL